MIEFQSRIWYFFDVYIYRKKDCYVFPFLRKTVLPGKNEQLIKSIINVKTSLSLVLCINNVKGRSDKVVELSLKKTPNFLVIIY